MRLGIVEPKDICFVTSADQQLYVDQFNRKHEKFVQKYGNKFPVYVSTNLPRKIKKVGNLKVFNLSDLQKRHKDTMDCESIAPDKIYSYYKYPWNTKRHIINKAFVDGYKYVIWTECDAHFESTTEKLFKTLDSMEINNVYTFSTIWRYKDSPKLRIFSDYKKIVSDLKININEEYYNSHDGTNVIYYLDKKTQLNFIKEWDKLVSYRYEQNPKRPKNGWIENMAFVLGANNIGVQPLGRGIFAIRHESEFDNNAQKNKKKGYGR